MILCDIQYNTMDINIRHANKKKDNLVPNQHTIPYIHVVGQYPYL